MTTLQKMGALLSATASLTLVLLFTRALGFWGNDDEMGGGGLSFKSMFGKTNYESTEPPEVCFDDVRGCDEVKSELEEIVEYLRDPEKFERLGGQLPRGVLLYGPPGTGKTLLAKAIAGEAQTAFFYAAASEFEEMFVGLGASRVRDLFERAKEASEELVDGVPRGAIIFIDELDAIGNRSKSSPMRGPNQTLNQLLTCLDGFEGRENVVIVAATNFPESLDKALTRPGRFDKKVAVPLPTRAGRRDILQIYANKLRIDDTVDLDRVAGATPGFSGAQLFNMLNQAAIEAAKQGAPNVRMAHIEWARDRILMGSERRNIMDAKQTRATAWHEAGHALVALRTRGADPIHKATVLPRGMALGMVQQLPDQDKVALSKREALARLDVCFGGRIAEEVFLGKDDVSSGASNDFEQATQLATHMVTQCGWAEEAVGLQHIDLTECSSEMRRKVDKEVRRLLDESVVRVRTLLHERRDELERVAEALVMHETLTGEEVELVADGNELDRDNLSLNVAHQSRSDAADEQPADKQTDEQQDDSDDTVQTDETDDHATTDPKRSTGPEIIELLDVADSADLDSDVDADVPLQPE
ncbi:MAG: hypothetical protein MHM6MM_001935 [Cercozoa sp. M6MM]